jgi:lipoprotein-anchoring transpeptidase ErfK/SrfK
MSGMRRTWAALAALVTCTLTWAGTAGAQEPDQAPAADPIPQPITPVPAAPLTPPKRPLPVTPAPKVFQPPAPNARQSWIATIHSRVVVRTAPRPGAPRRMVLSPTAPFAGGIVQLAISRSVVRDGELWVEVLLPRRPNGARGWIHGDAVTLSSTPFRVEIRLRSTTLIVYRAGRPFFRARIGVGKSNTPTPVGRFAIAETIQTNLPRGFLGPIVLPITGYSRVFNEFMGGDGRVAIHGTSLPGLLPGAISNGCIRLTNRDIARLARVAKPGVRVDIRS